MAIHIVLMEKSHSVKICVSGKCRGRGSDRVAGVIERDPPENASVERTSHCMGYCGMGPNVAVDGNILHQMHPDTAVKRVEAEITHPSPKVHGLGGKPIDDLDELLDSL